MPEENKRKQGLAERLSAVQEQIRRAEREAGRKDGSVELIAVTKGFPVQDGVRLAELDRPLWRRIEFRSCFQNKTIGRSRCLRPNGT